MIVKVLHRLIAAGVVDLIIFFVALLTSVVLKNNLLILDGDPHGEYHKIQEDENRDSYVESVRDPEYLKIEIRKGLNKRNELNG